MRKMMIFGFGAVLVALAAACSSDNNSTSGSTVTQTKGASPTSSVCASKDAVQNAFTDLTSIDVRAEGTNAVNAAVDKLKTATDDLKKAVSSDIGDEVDGLQTAVSDAKTTLSGIKDDATLNEKIDAVQSALTEIATAFTNLVSALKTRCG